MQVVDLNLTLFEGQISVLLGPNGAGTSWARRTEHPQRSRTRTRAHTATRHKYTAHSRAAHTRITRFIHGVGACSHIDILLENSCACSQLLDASSPSSPHIRLSSAGKSTTISMLTGLIPPTSGDAIVCGRNIVGSMQQIRKGLGVCGQDDRLFPEISVEKHLKIYCMFKSVPSEKTVQAVDAIIAAVGLREKRHVLSSQLSGGMKRKLGLAIALIGGSRVVVLDGAEMPRRYSVHFAREAKKGSHRKGSVVADQSPPTPPRPQSPRVEWIRSRGDRRGRQAPERLAHADPVCAGRIGASPADHVYPLLLHPLHRRGSHRWPQLLAMLCHGHGPAGNDSLLERDHRRRPLGTRPRIVRQMAAHPLVDPCPALPFLGGTRVRVL